MGEENRCGHPGVRIAVGVRARGQARTFRRPAQGPGEGCHRDRRFGHVSRRHGTRIRAARHLHRRQARPADAGGLDIVRNLASSGRLRPIVMIGLGTNYIVTTGELQQLMQLIGPYRKLVLINTYVPDGWSKDVNATIAAFIRRTRASSSRTGSTRSGTEPTCYGRTRSIPRCRGPSSTRGWCTGRSRPPAISPAQRPPRSR